MAFEKECDEVLKYLTDVDVYHGLAVYTHFKEKLDVEQLIVVLSILADNKFVFISGGNQFIKDEETDKYKTTMSVQISQKGLAFAHTDTFVERKKRWDIETKTKSFSYKYRWVGWALSLLAITISVFAYIKPSTDRQILLLPEKERKQQSTKPDTLTMRDTLYKK